MVYINSWKFSQRCYGNQNIFWPRNVFNYKVWLLTVTFIYVFINSSSSADFISANNVQYPTGVQERECFIGRLCDYEIPDDTFLCNVENFVISTNGERFLPKWLSFNEGKQTFLGIPSEKEEGIHEILIVGLGKLPSNAAGYICGSTTLKVTVWKLKDFPLFIENSLLGVKTFQGDFDRRYTCAFNEPVILASLVLPIKFQTGNEAVDFLKVLSSGYNMDDRDTFILPNTDKNPFLNLLESSHVVASGPGANSNDTVGPSTLLTWHVKCGVIHLNDPLFDELKHLSQKRLLTKNISFAVVAWHVITGFQKHYVKHGVLRRKRNVIGGTTTPVYSTIPISTATVVTTRLKPKKTSYISLTVLLTRPKPSPTFSSPFRSTSKQLSAFTSILSDTTSVQPFSAISSSSFRSTSKQLSPVNSTLSRITSVEPTYTFLSHFGSTSKQSSIITSTLSGVTTVQPSPAISQPYGSISKTSSRIKSTLTDITTSPTIPSPYGSTAKQSSPINSTLYDITTVQPSPAISQPYGSISKQSSLINSTLSDITTVQPSPKISQPYGSISKQSSLINSTLSDITTVQPSPKISQPYRSISKQSSLINSTLSDITTVQPSPKISQPYGSISKQSSLINSTLSDITTVQPSPKISQPYGSISKKSSLINSTLTDITTVQPSPIISQPYGSISKKSSLINSTLSDITTVQPSPTIPLLYESSLTLSDTTSVRPSPEILRSLNVSMSQLSSSKLHTLNQPSLTSSLPYLFLPSSRMILSSRSHPASNDILSSTTFRNTTTTVLSYFTSNNTDYATSSRRSSSKISPLTSSPTIFFEESSSKTQSGFESFSGLTTILTQLPSSTATYIVPSTQPRVKTSNYYSGGIGSTIAINTTQLVLSYPSRTSSLGQTKTIASILSQSSLLSFSVTPSFSTTSLYFSHGSETATKKITIFSSELIKFSFNDSTTGSSLPEIRTSVPIGFSLQTSISDSKTFNRTLFQTLSKQIQTEISSKSSAYLFSDNVGTTTVTSPVQTSFAGDSQTKGTSSFVFFTATTLLRSRSDKTSIRNVAATTFITSKSKSIVQLSSLGLTRSSLTTEIIHSTLELFTPTRNQSTINTTSKTFKSPLPTLSPMHKFTTTLLNKPTEQLMQTSSFTNFAKEPLSTLLLIRPSSSQSSVQTISVSSSGQAAIYRTPSLSMQTSSAQRYSVQRSPPSSSSILTVIISSLSQPVASGYFVQSSSSLNSTSYVKLSIQSPSSSSSLVQTAVVKSSLSTSSSYIEFTIVQSLSSLNSTSYVKFSIQSPSSSSSLFQTTVVKSSLSTSSSYIEFTIVQSLSSLNSTSSVRISIQTPSPSSSLARTFSVPNASLSVASSSVESIITQSSSSLNSSSSVRISIQTPSPSSSLAQTFSVHNASLSVASSSVESIITQSSSSLNSSSSAKISIQSPSPSSSLAQTFSVPNASLSVASSSVESIITQSSSSLNSTSSVRISIQTPSPSSSLAQTFSVSNASLSVASSSVESIITQSASSLNSSSSAKISIQSSSPSFSLAQTFIVPNASLSVASRSVESIITQSSSSLNSSSSAKISIQSPSPSFSLAQTFSVPNISLLVASRSVESIITQSSSALNSSNSAKISIQSPSPSFSLAQTFIVPDVSLSVASSPVESMIQSSSSLTYKRSIKLSVQSPSPLSSFFQATLISSSLPSTTASSSVDSMNHQTLSSLNYVRSAKLSIQSSSLSSSLVQTFIVPIASLSATSSSVDSMNHQTLSSLNYVRSAKLSIQSSSLSSSLVQTFIVPIASLSATSSSVDSIIVQSSSSLNSSSSIELSRQSPSLFQSVIVSTSLLSTAASSSAKSIIAGSSSWKTSTFVQVIIDQTPSLSSTIETTIVSLPSSQASRKTIIQPWITSSSLYSSVQSVSLLPPSISIYSTDISSSAASSSVKSIITQSTQPWRSTQLVVYTPSSPIPSIPITPLNASTSPHSVPSVILQSITSFSYLKTVVTIHPSPFTSSHFLIDQRSSSYVPSSSGNSAFVQSSSPSLATLSTIVSSQSNLPLSLYSRSSLTPQVKRTLYTPSLLAPSFTHFSLFKFSSTSPSSFETSTKTSMSFGSPSIAHNFSSSILLPPLTSKSYSTSSSVFMFSPIKSSFYYPSVSSHHDTPSRHLSVSTTTNTIEVQSQSSISPPDLSSIISTRSYSTLVSSPSIVVHPTTPSNNSPKLYNSFDLLIVKVGKVFSVQIPIDTFHDREDGNTRNLLLNCLDGDHKPLSQSSWLQFNTTTQTLYGIVLRSQLEQIKSSREYLLIARDSEGNKAYDAFTFDLQENEKALAMTFTLRITGTSLAMFNQDLNNVLSLVKKIASYYGDEDESMIQVMTLDDGSLLFTWSNTTLQSCNLSLINKLTSKIITKEGNIQPSFRSTLLPTFVADNIHENETGVCIPPVPTAVPSVARVSSHDDSLWLKYFLPGLIVGLLIIIIAFVCFVKRRHSGAKVLKIDEKTFKRRKPVIFDDELEVTTLPGKPIELPDDSLTPIRYTKETSFINPDFDDEEFPLWSSAPSYQRAPPKYGGDIRGFDTPPPPYKLPPLYNVK